MSSLPVQEDEEEERWVPTHVQVTVLRGRGLRGKGKHGTSDVYAIIQLGKEKYSTGVVERSTEPEWREECCFELLQPPGQTPGPGRRGVPVPVPAPGSELVLTVMHRALIGLDVFLGQAVVQLDEVFHQSRWVKNQWYRLNSKTGKKEKERGDIQVSVQFTRNNLTASMYDLVMKDKGTSTFNKLKERMRGKRRSSEEDSSSAVVVPGGNGTANRVRTRLPSDGGGEEDYEDDEGGEARRSKMRTFFLRGKLRKSSDTRSSTSLGSESSESSRGGSLSPTAGISVVVSDLSNSPSNSSNLTADYSPEHTENTSPKSRSLRCDSGDEAGEITIAVPQLTVCVNGSHAYKVQPPDPGSGKPLDSLGLGLLQKSLPVSVSLQNLSPLASADPHKAPAGDGRRWSFDKPGEEEKAAIAAALEQSGPMQGEEEEEEEERLGRAALSESQGKKQRRKGSKDGSEGGATPEKHKGWFGSKDSNSKPSLVVSPKLDPNTDPLHSSPPPSGPPVDLASLVSPLHHTNPFCRSQTSPPPISPCNPFFSVLQHNPFYDDMLTTPPPTPPLPPLPYLSSSRPPIAQLFPQASNPGHTVTHDHPASEDSGFGTDVAASDRMAEVERGLLYLAPTEEENPFSEELSDLLMFAGQLQPDSEWDESFEAFAAGRLQSPEDLSTDCKTQQNTLSDHPLENCNNKGTLLPIGDWNTSENDALHHHPCRKDPSDAQEATDTFAQFLETIPEQINSESDYTTLNLPPDLSKLDSCMETNQASSTTNTNMHQTPGNTSSTQHISSSPDPASSGLGSSVEDDVHSCLSSYADKLSASSSSEESEARNFESNIQDSDAAVSENQKPSESEEDITDKPNDWTVVEVSQQIQQQDGDGGPDNSEEPQSPVIPHQEPEITARETESKGAATETLNLSDVPALLPNVSEVQLESNDSSQSDVFKNLILDFSEEFNDSSGNNNTEMNILVTPDDEFSSKLPSLYVLTSSPDLKQRLLDTSLGRQEASRSSPVSFGAFGETRPGLDLDSTLLHTQVSDQSSSSFLHSLYVSTDSQDYQTCASQPSSSVSELEETRLSANSTLCGELSDIQTTADAALGLEESTGASTSSSREINQTNRFEEYDDKTKFMIGDGFDLEVLPAAPTDSVESCGPKRLGEENQNDDEFSRCPQAQSSALHRSHSEGTLAPGFDDLLLPSFGSDPGAIQESSSVPPDLALPSLTSFAPSLTLSSSSLVLRSFPPLASALAGSPPSTPQAAVPQPEETQEQQQQEQAAGQQNSPHPVRPLTTAMQAEEKRTEGRSVLATGLEKLKSTIHPGRSSQASEAETDRRKSLTEGAGSYYHLTHSELVALLGQREADLRRQGAEFERQRVLLAKRELELRRLKPQVRDLEDYIDTLLVSIMEQKPTLLQVRSKLK